VHQSQGWLQGSVWHIQSKERLRVVLTELSSFAICMKSLANRNEQEVDILFDTSYSLMKFSQENDMSILFQAAK
jgi:hypothetical protein